MAESNTEIWKRVITAFNEAGLDAALEYFAPDAEVFDPDLPSGPLRGHDQIRETIGEMVGAFETMQVQDFEFIPVGDRVVGLFHTTGHGTGTRGEMRVEVRDAHVMTFKDGKITYWRLYVDQNEALADAGLEPRSAQPAGEPEPGGGGGDGGGQAP
jgi:ketosteroid isomerase-like protein